MTEQTKAPRVCYALQTLLEEVAVLFPEATFETGKPNGWGVELEGRFRCDVRGFTEALLFAATADARVLKAEKSEGEIVVTFHPTPRTYDLRYAYALADVWEVVAETFTDSWLGSDSW